MWADDDESVAPGYAGGESIPDEDAEPDLKKAARFGIMLVEQNCELENENTSLRLHVSALESEHVAWQAELEARNNELERVREERRQCLLEVNALLNESRASSLKVADLTDRGDRLMAEKAATDDARRAAERQCSRLQSQLHELQRSRTKVANPPTTCDSTVEHEELQLKWQRTSDEIDTLHLEVKSLRKDLVVMTKETSTMESMQLALDRLEKHTHTTTREHDNLVQEIRELLRSNEAMATTYKV